MCLCVQVGEGQREGKRISSRLRALGGAQYGLDLMT